MPFTATPNYHYRHPSLQNYPGPVKASQSTAENQDSIYSMITSTAPSQPRLFIATPNLSQPLQTINAITHITSELPWISQSFPDHSKQPGLTVWDHQHCSNQPRHFLVPPYLSRPVQITNAITRHSIPTTGHSKLHQSFTELHDRLSPL